jgi:myo-inositol-1(or 4)-monophosphatase
VSARLRVEALEAIADAAAETARRLTSLPLDLSEKDDASPVTAVDRGVNELLLRELTALVPGSGWLSEENVDDRERLSRPSVWIVDPIDGTKQLVRGIPELAISFGLVARGEIVAAAVVNPATGERGVWVDGQIPLFRGLRETTHATDLASATAIVSLSEAADGDLAGLTGLVPRTRAVGSVAYKLLRVASGADTLTYSLRPKFEWDICGGVGLVRAAGGVVLRLDGAPIRFNQHDTRIPSGAVAGPEPLAEALRVLILERLRTT